MATSIRPIPAAQTWPIRHRVMWPDHPLSFVQLDRDETDGVHLGLFADQRGEVEEPVSIVSVFVDGDSAQFRKLATLVKEQGKGYGSHLLRYLIGEWCPTHGIRRLWCNARVAKADFYERFGLRATERTYEKGGISFVVMEMSVP